MERNIKHTNKFLTNNITIPVIVSLMFNVDISITTLSVKNVFAKKWNVKRDILKPAEIQYSKCMCL